MHASSMCLPGTPAAGSCSTCCNLLNISNKLFATEGRGVSGNWAPPQASRRWWWLWWRRRRRLRRRPRWVRWPTIWWRQTQASLVASMLCLRPQQQTTGLGSLCIACTAALHACGLLEETDVLGLWWRAVPTPIIAGAGGWNPCPLTDMRT